MDTITHALSGMLLGRATTPNKTTGNTLSLRARLTAGLLAAAFPDIDIIARFIGLLTYLESHRGITHSIILLPVWAIILSFIFSRFSKGRYQWQDFYLISAGGIGIHILGDVITAYGTMMLAPFSYTKFAWPSTFIIDFYFTGIIVIALIMAKLFHQYGKRIAIAGLSMLASYIIYQGTLYSTAVEIAQGYVQQRNIQQAEVYAMPQPLSPYHWKVIVRENEKYHMSYIDLKSDKVLVAEPGAGMFEKIEALYRPVSQLQWMQVAQYGEKDIVLAKQVWGLDIMQPIRHFMMLPVVDDTYNKKIETSEYCVWFKDHRFILDGVRHSPFRFGACKETNNSWKLFRLSDGVPVLLFK